MRGGFFLLASLTAGAVWGGQPATLKYSWERGQSYVYKVDIVAKHGKYTSSARGHTVYGVRAANLHGYTIRNHDFFSIQRHTTQGRLFPPFGIFKIGWRHFDGASVGRKLRPHFDAVIDRQGKWLASSGVSVPVRDLSNPATLVMEILPGDSGDEWETETKVQVIHERREENEGAGRLVKLVKTPLAATEKTKFSVTGSSNRLTKINKTYRLATHPNEDGLSLIVTGKGELDFDQQLGVFRRMDFKGEINETRGEEKQVTPIEISYKLLEGAERTKALKPPPPSTIKERRPLTADQLDEALRDLKRRLSFPRHRAADRLSRAEPGKRRAEVAMALQPSLNDTDEYTRQAACRALAIWGDTSSVPNLIQRLDDHSMTVRWAALDALAKLPDARAARPIAKHMARGLETTPATIALARIGPPAEVAMVSLLNDKSALNRQTALQLLAHYGTHRSALPLMARLNSKDTVTANLARQALESILKRQGQEPLRGQK